MRHGSRSECDITRRDSPTKQGYPAPRSGGNHLRPEGKPPSPHDTGMTIGDCLGLSAGFVKGYSRDSHAPLHRCTAACPHPTDPSCRALAVRRCHLCLATTASGTGEWRSLSDVPWCYMCVRQPVTARHAGAHQHAHRGRGEAASAPFISCYVRRYETRVHASTCIVEPKVGPDSSALFTSAMRSQSLTTSHLQAHALFKISSGVLE